MSKPARPLRQQPTRLPRPWDSPGKNTAVGCHFLFQCMKGKSESEVTQSCPTVRDPMDCSIPGSSVHGIFQARVLEWGAKTFLKGSIPLQLYLLVCLWLCKRTDFLLGLNKNLFKLYKLTFCKGKIRTWVLN